MYDTIINYRYSRLYAHHYLLKSIRLEFLSCCHLFTSDSTGTTDLGAFATVLHTHGCMLFTFICTPVAYICAYPAKVFAHLSIHTHYAYCRFTNSSTFQI